MRMDKQDGYAVADLIAAVPLVPSAIQVGMRFIALQKYKENTMATVQDVVCGMDIEPAQAAGTSEYQGQTYYFCSIGCKRQFDKDPQRYIAAHPDSETK